MSASRTTVLLTVLLATSATCHARDFRAGPYDGAPQGVARQLLADHGAALGVPAGMDMEVGDTERWRGRTVVRLQQHHRGVPVRGRGARIKIDGDGRVSWADVDVRDGLTVGVVPGVDAVTAAQVVLDHLGVIPVVVPEPLLEVLPTGDGRLVYTVLVSTAAPMRSWKVTLDAATAAVLDVTDLRREAQGNVYIYSPAHGDPAEVTLTDLTGDLDVMSGSYALVQSVVFDGDTASYDHLATADEQGDFLFEPELYSNADPFVEVHAYHHVTELSHFFEDVHGHAFGGAMQVLTNYRDEEGTGYDNAFFTQDMMGNDVIAFGDGTYDFGYDAGVIAHEFGHAIVQARTDMLQDWMIHDEYGQNNAPNGIHEGMADYWAGSYQDQSLVSSYIPIGRDLDNDSVCPDDLTGESHDDGEIVGAAAWDVYQQVGKDATDAIVYGGLGLVSDAPTFAELAEAFIEAAGDLEADGDITADDLAAIEAAMEERGMLACGRSLPIDTDEPFHYDIGLMWGMTELDDEWCDRMRDAGMAFPPSFQFALTTPPAEEGVVEEVVLSVEMTPVTGAEFDEDDLIYTWFLRGGDLVRFDYELVETGGGHEIETPVGLEYDLELTDEPETITLSLDDEAIELLPETTYYLALLHQNCRAASMTVTAEMTLADPAGDDDDSATPADDDQEDDGGCGCRQSGPAVEPLLGAALCVAMLLLLGARRRSL